MNTLSFEQLPDAVAKLSFQIGELQKLITERNEPTPEQPKDVLFTVEQAADFLTLSVPTIYSKVSRRELPYMKRGKRLYFSKDELLQYLQAGRKQTLSEIENEAGEYLTKRKGGYSYEK